MWPDKLAETYMRQKSILLIILSAVILTSCFIGAGTHGSLKGYEYQTTKQHLENAVMDVIKSNPNINRDTVGKTQVVNIGGGKQGTIVDNSYNDGKEYVTVNIKSGKDTIEYTFRYYGGQEYWDSSKTSEIFICWAHDQSGRRANNMSGDLDKETLKLFTSVFEKELVEKIDKKLNLTHKDTD